MDLPVLSFLKARSSYALVLTVITTLLNLFHVDFYAITCSAILACSQKDTLDLIDRAVTVWPAIIDALQPILPAVGALWLWIERRAPKYQIGLTGKPAESAKN